MRLLISSSSGDLAADVDAAVFNGLLLLLLLLDVGVSVMWELPARKILTRKERKGKHQLDSRKKALDLC